MTYYSFLSLLFMLIFNFVEGHFERNGSSKDLEKFPSDVVIDLKRIIIPNHTLGFNPSLVRWNEKLLLSFREIHDPQPHSSQSAAKSTISLVWLDDEFNPINTPFTLDFNSPLSCTDDARLLVVGEDLYILYSDNVEELISDAGFRVWMAKIDVQEDKFIVYDKEKLTYFDGEQAFRREKNWTPFDYQGYLCLSYTLAPHKVFLPLKGTECCITLSESSRKLPWNWGELRGGTPAIQVNGKYLTFFHSCIDTVTIHSEGKAALHYFLGAALFENIPPFEVTHMSTQPIVAKGFYSGETYVPYWKPVCAIFPCGILQDKDSIIVSYGRQDHEIWIARFDTDKLLNSLSEINN